MTNRRKGIIAGLAAMMAGLTRSYSQETRASSDLAAYVKFKAPTFILHLDDYEEDAKVLVIDRKGEKIELTAKEIMEALRP